MSEQWKTVQLGELVDLKRGISYGVVQPGDHQEDGVPIVRVTDIRQGRIATKDPLRIAPNIEVKYSRTRLRGGELLLSLVGTVGETAIVGVDLAGWNTARAVAVIPVLKRPGARWVHYVLRSRGSQAKISEWCNTTVQATLNLRDVVRLPIVVPPPRDREAIEVVLGALDDKIELNRQMNETLEEMGRALFKSWFVDFDPVHARIAGRLPRSINRAAMALFPVSLTHSTLGPVPDGWGHKPVSQMCEALFDGPHATPPESPNGAVFLGIRNFTPTGLILSDVRHISEVDWPRWTKRVVPRPDDIVFTYEATLGYFALIPPGLRVRV